MRPRTLAIVTAAALLASSHGPVHARAGQPHGRSGQMSCDVTSCTVGAALEQACPCSDAAAHGPYVLCAVRAARRLVTSGVIGRRCRGRLVRLAAHSVCGRANAVVCLVPTSTCGADGTCTNDSSIDCLADTDCGTRCTVRTGDECTAANGMTADVGSCVFASCASPSGAFLDASGTF